MLLLFILLTCMRNTLLPILLTCMRNTIFEGVLRMIFLAILNFYVSKHTRKIIERINELSAGNDIDHFEFFSSLFNHKDDTLFRTNQSIKIL